MELLAGSEPPGGLELGRREGQGPRAPGRYPGAPAFQEEVELPAGCLGGRVPEAESDSREA